MDPHLATKGPTLGSHLTTKVPTSRRRSCTAACERTSAPARFSHPARLFVAFPLGWACCDPRSTIFSLVRPSFGNTSFCFFPELAGISSNLLKKIPIIIIPNLQEGAF